VKCGWTVDNIVGRETDRVSLNVGVAAEQGWGRREGGRMKTDRQTGRANQGKKNVSKNGKKDINK